MWTSANAIALAELLAIESAGYPARSLAWLQGAPVTREASELVAGLVAGIATGRLPMPDAWNAEDWHALEGLAGIDWHRINRSRSVRPANVAGVRTNRPTRASGTTGADERTVSGVGSDRTGAVPGSDAWADQVQAVADRAREMAREVASGRRSRIVED
jgi:hypothetical protein